MTVSSTSSSTSSFSYLQYKNKISGLVSGMDIDSIMEKLMKAESAQMEKLQQQKQKYEWKRDAYREVNTSLNAFDTGLWDNFGLSSKWSSKTISNSDTTNRVTVTAGSTANGQLKIENAVKATNSQGSFSNTGTVNQTIATTSSKISDLGISIDNSFFDSSAPTDPTVSDVINRFKEKGYTATFTGGKLALSPTSTAQSLTSVDKDVLTSLGVTSQYANATSAVLKVGISPDDKNITTSTKLADLGISGSGVMKISIDGVEKNIDYDETDTVENLLKKVNTETGLSATLTDGVITLNSASNKTFSVDDAPSELGFKEILKATTGSVNYSANVTGATITGKNTIAELTGSSDDGDFTIRSITADGTYKDTKISFAATDTIDSVMSRINSSVAGITAIFNKGQLSISSNNTGQRTDGNPEVSILTATTSEGVTTPSNEAGLNIFKNLGVTDAANANGEIQLASGGKDASATINGVAYSQKSNTFNVAGYSISLNADIDSSNPISISSTNNSDDVVSKVKEFIETYNGLIKSLTTQVNEKKQIDYQPLTDAQKAEMTDSEIEKWETNAKKGIIKNDSAIRDVLAKMRETIYSGTGSNTLYNIGITTTASYNDGGLLEVDEDKLKEALEKDPAVVSRLFTGDGAGNKGIISTMRTAAQTAVKSIELSAGKESMSEETYTLGKDIIDVTSKITDWKTRLKSIEERYWTQFSAMETAIQKANSQSSLFTE